MLKRLFAPAPPALAPLYAAVVAEARAPAWYAEGGVPDTFDGRFDMLVALLARVLARLDPGDAALLTERFIADMDGNVRERGVGDLLVGKHVGRMVAALGGRLSAYGAAMAAGGTEGGTDDAPLADALARNLWRGHPPGADALAFTVARYRAFDARIAALDPRKLVEGHLG